MVFQPFALSPSKGDCNGQGKTDFETRPLKTKNMNGFRQAQSERNIFCLGGE